MLHQNGKVYGPDKREITFGKLVDAARKLTPPKTPVLKDDSKFDLIGNL